MSTISNTGQKRTCDTICRIAADSAAHHDKTRKLIAPQNAERLTAICNLAATAISQNSSTCALQHCFLKNHLFDPNLLDIIADFFPDSLILLSSACSKSSQLLEEIINTIGDNAQNQFLLDAFEKGDEELVGAFIRSDKFYKISKETLKSILVRAVRLGHAKKLKAFVKSCRFGEIPKQTLESAFEIAGRAGYPDSLNILIASERFSEISQKNLEWMLNFTERPETVIALVRSPRFIEISKKAMEFCFQEAARFGNAKILDSLIQSPRFDEISKEQLELAFQEALKRGDQNVVNALIGCRRFSKIPKEVLDSMLDKLKAGIHRSKS